MEKSDGREIAVRRMFAKPEHFRVKAARYFRDAEEAGQPITLTGFCLAMGFRNKSQPRRYAEKYPEMKDAVDEAFLRIEHAYEQNLLQARNPTGTIFALKNFGWRDSPEKKPDEEGQKVILNFNLGTKEQTVTIEQKPRKEITDGSFQDEVPDDEEGEEEEA